MLGIASRREHLQAGGATHALHLPSPPFGTVRLLRLAETGGSSGGALLQTPGGVQHDEQLPSEQLQRGLSARARATMRRALLIPAKNGRAGRGVYAGDHAAAKSITDAHVWRGFHRNPPGGRQF